MKATHASGGAALLQVLLAFVVNTNAPASAATSASPPARAVGLRGYRRFHANDSYIGKPIPCTYEEKVCFRHNTLFVPESGRCLRSPDDPCEFVGDRQEFLHGSGHLVAMCPGYDDPCADGKYRMAYDGRCYRKQMLRDVMCGCAAEPTAHFLGGVECRCSPANPIRVEQPHEEGRCRIPDLRFPDEWRDFLYGDPNALLNLTMQCTATQAACFSNGTVAVRGKGRRCYRLHERGPCPRDHVVALDRRAALSSRAEATCVHVRGGCPRAQKRLASDGRCHKDRDLRILTFGNVDMSVDGRIFVNPPGQIYSVALRSRPVPGNESFWECLFGNVMKGGFDLRHYPNPPCAPNNNGLCHLFEVEAEVPLPDLD